MIYLVPSIKEPYTRQLEISVDIKLIKMLKNFTNQKLLFYQNLKIYQKNLDC